MALENRLGLGFIRQPKYVLFGPGQRGQLGLMAKGLGRRALVVTDERMATTAEFRSMLANLAEEGVKTFVYDKALPDLPRRNNPGELIGMLVGAGQALSLSGQPAEPEPQVLRLNALAPRRFARFDNLTSGMALATP